jgi:hypothetical protein
MEIKDELKLRELLWIRHDSSHFSALYGDDGEMQCGACLIDFKRDAPEVIEAQLQRYAQRKMKS